MIHGWISNLEMGWKYGETYDPENKIHPDIVPYEIIRREMENHYYMEGGIK